MRWLLAVLAAFWMTAAQAGTPVDLGARLVGGYIRPASTHFSNAAAALSGALDYHCRAPDPLHGAVVRDRFESLVDAWFRIAFLRFGPLVEDNRFERVFFWPDPRGITLRQVQNILASNDMKAINPDQLAEKSVAVQGLPALEYALFGTGADSIIEGSPEGRYRCAYALAISNRLSAVAAEITEAWSANSEFARDFAMPGAQNELYRSQKEVAAEAIKAMASGLAFTSDAIVAPFLAKDPDMANYKRAPFWRSEWTIPAIGVGIEGIRDFYIASGFAGSLDVSDAWIDGGLQLELRKIIEALDSIDEPLSEAVTPGSGREALVYSVIAMKSLHTTIDTRLAAATGVSVGFNALDGD